MSADERFTGLNREIGYMTEDDPARGKQDPGFYDNVFHEKHSRGRLTDWPIRMATHIKQVHPGLSMAEIGGGRCWLPYVCTALNVDARGYDISEWAIANSPMQELVLPKQNGPGRVHVLNISEGAVTPPADIVVCHNVLGYLHEDEIDWAFENLVASFNEYLYLGIVTADGWTKAKTVAWANHGRPYLRPGWWWDKKIKEHGLVPAKDLPAGPDPCYEKKAQE